MQPAKELQLVSPMIVEAVRLFNRMEEMRQEIARRAYERFEERGQEHGRDLDDWAAAEAELLAPVSMEMTESANHIEITAEVPGFNEHDIEIALEPRRVFLSGRQEKALKPDPASPAAGGRRTSMFFGTIDLPADIDTAKAAARFEDGRFILKLPRLAAPESAEASAEPEPPAE